MFSLGQTLITRGANQAITRDEAIGLLDRHRACDWGDLDEHDRRANGEALRGGDRILSTYTVRDHRIYVITEADRSATTILLAAEY